MHEAVSNDDYAELQRQPVRHPDQCDPPERCEDARKVRMAVWGKAKAVGRVSFTATTTLPWCVHRDSIPCDTIPGYAAAYRSR